MATPAAESPLLPRAEGRGKRRRDAFSLLHLLTETDRFLTLARELAANPRRRDTLGGDLMFSQDTVGADLILRGDGGNGPSGRTRRAACEVGRTS